MFSDSLVVVAKLHIPLIHFVFLLTKSLENSNGDWKMSLELIEDVKYNVFFSWQERQVGFMLTDKSHRRG